ncbi:MAG TPA: 6-carboxytetrahydropterin synthase QueD [Methylomusa anaerophila]|uniref:6-carboxy-5,6,7,8-tetrahydropterin synthase n=1 Tax=Methylomusa anaerophila TaxID=1930071 RepID=A0A348APR4_9FIRM|nr:6-carboxytetrahydropterin synthase QueD [Methylomusa anaerophila]BBB93062.1 6-carboxy-5,6,7,8-tetrahydropterin synthase [Methylomusa anaerophila]HML87105.1 6-carboxytetrahydropterin synthase QueD [Methylomusa anaerophila]
MYELTIIAEFEAAHRLPEYPGKCCRLHGHNWKVEVTIAGTKLNKQGMVIDFREFKSAVGKVIDQLDHYYLNELEAFQEVYPTAENIAKYIYDKLNDHPSFTDASDLNVRCITVWESPRSAVKYCPGE